MKSNDFEAEIVKSINSAKTRRIDLSVLFSTLILWSFMPHVSLASLRIAKTTSFGAHTSYEERIDTKVSTNASHSKRPFNVVRNR